MTSEVDVLKANEVKSSSAIDLVQLGQALALFQNTADQHCLTGTIERCMNKWRVQLVSSEGQKTIPVIDSSLSKAVRKAVDSFQNDPKISDFMGRV